MADANGGADKLLYWVCNNPLVRKKINCGDCGVWSRLSCAEKKKCCDSGSAAQTSDIEDVNSVKNLVATINSLTMMLADVRKVVGDLVEENKRLRQEIELLKDEKSHGPCVLSDVKILEEVEERQFRSHNIIISNLPESQEESNEKKATDDGNKVVNLISATGIGETEILKTVRIGKISNKPRLIKVTLSSSVIVREIVTKYRTRNGIYVNRDLTKMQQDVAYKTRKEFKERVNKGEKNISLKYYNGVPKIVTKNNH
ncbi:hypothetical protein Zmor_021895 [Zophobas morio]|uniref:Uncharacterized protein n=1 Tax=Zophobas morio TaxID=2755281 RepID=A0AA38I6N0_9CUCU|nr:hypothetical protein Zmor_021895 [Zophobas morio]